MFSAGRSVHSLWRARTWGLLERFKHAEIVKPIRPSGLMRFSGFIRQVKENKSNGVGMWVSVVFDTQPPCREPGRRVQCSKKHLPLRNTTCWSPRSQPDVQLLHSRWRLVLSCQRMSFMTNGLCCKWRNDGCYSKRSVFNPNKSFKLIHSPLY